MKRDDTEEAARALLEQICSYWAARGYTVNGCVTPAGYCPRLRSTVYEVHTDLVNGQPRQRTGELQRAA